MLNLRVMIIFLTLMMLFGVGGVGGVALKTAQGQEKVSGADLRPMWTVGQVSVYQSTFTKLTTIKIDAFGTKRTVNQKVVVNSNVEWKVIEVNEAGGGVAEMTIKSMKMAATGANGKTVEIDQNSDEPKYASAAKRFSAIIDSPVKVTVDGTGKVTGVEGYEAIREKAEVKNEKALNDRTFKEMATDLAALSGGAKGRKAGDTWTQNNTWDHQMGELEYTTAYTLAGVEKIEGVGIAMINTESKINFTLKLPERPEGAPEVTVDVVEAKSSGQLMFDISRKELVGINWNQTLAFKTTMSLGQRTMEQNISEKSHSSIIRISEE